MKSKNYEEFVEKFKQKKTTDDCYTPPIVYEAISEWVSEEYGLNKDTFARPFYPGGDYENFDYKNKIVVDNPPFSILSKIINFYLKNKIKFFLFAPTLTLFSGASENCTSLPVGITISYQNGANVNTSFVTNLECEDLRIRTAPELYSVVHNANKENLRFIKKQLPKYKYPKNVVTSAYLYQFSKIGIDLKIGKSECFKISALDSQKIKNNKIFGSGFLVSDKVKAELEKAELEKAELEKAEEWVLSEREKNIIKKLNLKGGENE